jgi:hypothetical protein
MYYRKFSLSAFFLSATLSLCAQQLVWTRVAEGVWKTQIGEPEAFDLFKAGDIDPNLVAISSVGNTGFPVDEQSVVGGMVDGKANLRFPLEKSEQIFGFGLNFKTIGQRGRILELHVDHYGGKDNGRTHAPIPFYVSDRGYGVFINSARYIKVWAIITVSEKNGKWKGAISKGERGKPDGVGKVTWKFMGR